MIENGPPPLFSRRSQSYLPGMMFWIITTAMTLLVVLLLALAVRRGGHQTLPGAAFDIQVYRDQLAEVDRDLARGVLGEEDAERVRTEISRRILSADAALRDTAAEDTHAGRRVTTWLSAGIVAIVIGGGSFVTYTQLGAPGYGDLALSDRIALAEQVRQDRPSQAAAEASLTEAELPRAAPPSEDYAELVAQLRDVVEERPGDARGLRLLALAERNLGNFSAARNAFSRYLDITASDAEPQEFAELADLMVTAAGGYVSPEAEAALAIALERDPGNGSARYYWGLMLSQTGRPDQTFQIWDALLRAGPAEAPWIRPIQAQIEEMAFRAGVNYTVPAPGPGLRGPTAEDIANADEMSPTERMNMIGGMVEGLAARLSTEGGPASEWAQLITALTVLERRADAFNVYQNAIRVFADDKTALDLINRAGQRAGVAE